MPLYSSSYINPSVLKADGSIQLTCGAVPYPFGTAGIALPGFEIGCLLVLENPWISRPFLSISSKTYSIQEISLQGYIKIIAGPIYKSCFDGNGKWKESEGSRWLNLEGTPFALSYQYNMLTVVGCNNLVSIRRRDKNLTVTSGCVTFCDPQGTFIGGSCSGLGCCQATLPGTLKNFDLQFMRLSISNSSAGYNNCSSAFFSKRDYFQSNQSGFLFQDFNNIIQLDWAIGNKSCEASRNDIGSFACKNNSYCYNSPSMAGYLCNCSKGYDGNPYAEDGCTSIIHNCTDPRIPFTNNPTVGKRVVKSWLALVIAITGGCGLSFGFLLLLYFAIVKHIRSFEKRKQEKLKQKFFLQNRGLLLQQLIASPEDTTPKMRILNLRELEKATNRFDNALILGRGGHGEVYKGILLDQRVVAIKRSKIVDRAEIDQFINEVVILSQVNHRNIVKLYGCCLETEVPLLAYEFISNGTLFNHLHVVEHCSLTWKHRLRIALESAGAISYLHSSASISVFHRDIKSSNILLDDYFTAKVSDFGASRSVQIDQTGVTTAIQGTHGYLDPEYYCTGRLTQKSDVYSFGVILAELLTREKPLLSSRKFEGGSLIAYFSSAMKENHLFDILDPQVVNEGKITELEAIAKIAQMCLRMKGEDRPTMKEVEVRLDALWRSNQQHEHPWTSQSLEERQLMLPDYTAEIDTTLQCSFEEDPESSSYFPR